LPKLQFVNTLHTVETRRGASLHDTDNVMHQAVLIRWLGVIVSISKLPALQGFKTLDGLSR